jgi:hypothetical protein
MPSHYSSAESDKCEMLLQVDVLRRMQGRAEALRLLAVYEVKLHLVFFKYVQASAILRFS